MSQGFAGNEGGCMVVGGGEGEQVVGKLGG